MPPGQDKSVVFAGLTRQLFYSHYENAEHHNEKRYKRPHAVHERPERQLCLLPQVLREEAALHALLAVRAKAVLADQAPAANAVTVVVVPAVQRDNARRIAQHPRADHADVVVLLHAGDPLLGEVARARDHDMAQVHDDLAGQHRYVQRVEEHPQGRNQGAEIDKEGGGGAELAEEDEEVCVEENVPENSENVSGHIVPHRPRDRLLEAEGHERREGQPDPNENPVPDGIQDDCWEENDQEELEDLVRPRMHLRPEGEDQLDDQAVDDKDRHEGEHVRERSGLLQQNHARYDPDILAVALSGLVAHKRTGIHIAVRQRAGIHKRVLLCHSTGPKQNLFKIRPCKTVFISVIKRAWKIKDVL